MRLGHCFLVLLIFVQFAFIANYSEALNNNNFYGSCSGECVDLSSPLLLRFLEETNSNETFCLESIQEYISLNESIRVCISNNLTLVGNLSTNSENNFTTLDYFKLSDRQALLSFNSETYHTGLYKQDECYNAARRYICQHYFPLCDVSNDESKQIYNLCMSSCENYYSSCNSRELIDFRCLASSNQINRVYKGSWKEFDSASSVMCTGNAERVFRTISSLSNCLALIFTFLYLSTLL